MLDGVLLLQYYFHMECSRCGKCCFEPFYRHVRPADVEEWEKCGRSDLVSALTEEKKSNDRTNPGMASLGMAFHTCRFLKAGGQDKFKCDIYEHRPITCRDFYVGCSRLCPNYKGKRSLDEIRKELEEEKKNE
jgi:Fe-S-cluster containining protein